MYLFESACLLYQVPRPCFASTSWVDLWVSISKRSWRGSLVRCFHLLPTVYRVLFYLSLSVLIFLIFWVQASVFSSLSSALFHHELLDWAQLIQHLAWAFGKLCCYPSIPYLPWRVAGNLTGISREGPSYSAWVVLSQKSFHIIPALSVWPAPVLIYPSTLIRAFA